MVTAVTDFAALELPLDTLSPPLDWGMLFGRQAPVAIEIGTGNGYFIEAEAARLPDWNFLGIEREREFYEKMARRCVRAGLGNVRTTPVDALDVIDEWVAPQSVDRVYCYFSDPWHKRKHADRRVVTDAFPPRLETILKPGGELWFKTDVAWYFNLAVTVFRKVEGRWRLHDVRRFPPRGAGEGEVVTNFERKAREAGSEVWGFKAQWEPESGH